MSDASPPDADRPFRTDHLAADLKARSVRGGAVTLSAQAAKFILRTGALVLLARLLTPEAFGLIAMVVAVTSFVALFKDLGLSMATVQRAEVRHEQVNALFWVNAAVSLGATLLTAAAAPLVAWFYGEPRLVGITAALAGAVFLGGLAVQHEALLKRQMRFPALAGVEVAGLACGLGAALVAAWQGAGYWALVLQRLVQTGVHTGLAWTLCRWRPSRPSFGGEGVRSMLSFGGHLTGFQLVNYFARNTDDVLIGRFFGERALGLYSKAYQLMLFPLRQINAPLTSVMIPALSRLVDKPAVYRGTYLRALEKISMLAMPAVAFMIMTSDWIIALVLGSQWNEASDIFAFLGIAALVQPLANTTGWLFITQNRTRDLFHWGLLGSTLAVMAIVVGLRWGAVGVAAAYALSGVLLRMPLLLWLVGRRGPVRTRDHYGAVFPAACAAAAVFLGLYAFRSATAITGAVPGLGLALVIAILTALLVFALLPRGRAALRDSVELASLLISRKKEDRPEENR